MRIAIREVICATALGVFALNSYAMGDDTNDKDVCIKQAKANLTKAKEDAKASRKSKDAMASATHEKTEANYAVAKEKCDAMSGDAKSKCVADAKARYHQ